MLPTISVAHRTRIEAPFTALEVLVAIKSTKTGSAPGPDGFPALYYCKFQNALVPHLVEYFNAIQGGTPLDSPLYI